MASQAVVDELIVKLKLDASDYKTVEKAIDKAVAESERKLKQADDARNKRMKESQKTVKQFGMSLRGLALTMGAVLGVSGGAAGIIGAVSALVNFETNLRRAAVSTGMSNREMQAWGSAARRLGADAGAGAQAIADLAKEQKQFALTGNAPTMQALARLGINVTPESNIVDVIEQAQKTFRAASPGQQQQIESGLAASGVSNDLILLIKSEKDVREAFARSFSESANENRAALDRLADAFETVKAAGINFASTLANLLQPAAEQFGIWMGNFATELSAFNDRVVAAGGGIDGFMAVLTNERPALAATLQFLSATFQKLGEVVDVVVYGFQQMYRGVKMLVDWFDNKFGAVFGGGSGQVKGVLSSVGETISNLWSDTVKEARSKGAAPVGTITGASPSRPAARARAPIPSGTGAASTARPTAQDVMSYLVGQGLTVQQAAAVAANIQSESGFNAGAVNTAGGGQGARGLAQWRGARVDAFRNRFGVTPDMAPWQKQLDFLLTDPYERKLLNRSLAGPGGAADLGTSFSRVFEAHGNVAEDLRRGRQAANLANQFGQSQGTMAGAGPQFNINGPVTVVADKPQDFIGGIQRVSGVTNYNAAVR